MREPSPLEELFVEQIRERGLDAPVRQSNEPWKGTGRRFLADFFWPDHHLIIEVDGGTWHGGRHTRGVGYERDCEKLNLAVLAGYRVMKVTSTQVRKGQAIAWVAEYLTVD